MSRQWTTQNAHFPSQPRAVKGWLYPPHSFGRMSINFDNALTMFHGATSRRTDGHAACYPLCISLRWSRWRHSPSQRLTVIWSKGFYEPYWHAREEWFHTHERIISETWRQRQLNNAHTVWASDGHGQRAGSKRTSYELRVLHNIPHIHFSSRQYSTIREIADFSRRREKNKQS